MSSSSSSSSSIDDKVENLQTSDMDLFILAGKIAKQLADGTKTNNDRKKVLVQLASFYGLKLVPMNTVSQGSNQILNHLSGNLSNLKLQENNNSNKNYSSKSVKGQPPPNPIKKDPEFIKMNSERDVYVNQLRTLQKGSDEHNNVLKHVREIEIAMAKFKRERGRIVHAPAETQNITPQSAAASAATNWRCNASARHKRFKRRRTRCPRYYRNTKTLRNKLKFALDKEKCIINKRSYYRNLLFVDIPKFRRKLKLFNEVKTIYRLTLSILSYFTMVKMMKGRQAVKILAVAKYWKNKIQIVDEKSLTTWSDIILSKDDIISLYYRNSKALVSSND